jgi:hypothetical protein
MSKHSGFASVELAKALDAWCLARDTPSFMAYPLSHAYTRDSLSFDRLSTSDRAVADALQVFNSQMAQLPSAVHHELLSYARFPTEVIDVVLQYAPLHSGKRIYYVAS